MGCKAGTEAQAVISTGFNIYKLRPNYPVNLQDAADKKKCVVSCGTKMIWDKYLAKPACMA